jgi:uncharacterized protein (TIGR02099 family)
LVIRSLKFLALLARAAAWLALASGAAFMLAVAALHWLIVPRIDEFRPQLQAWATRTLGVPVRIGAIEARSGGLIAAVTLRDVVIADARGNVGLRIPEAVAAFSAASLLRGGLEQLVLDKPELSARRTASGRFMVAGFDLSGDAAASADTRAANWLFSQPELAVRGGHLRWQDEQRGAPAVTLSDVQIVLRNSRRTHQMQLQATPQAPWGDRFTLIGRFRQPLLSQHAGAWRTWRGQAYASFPRVDAAQLPLHVDLHADLGAQSGATLERGSGALRAWIDIAQGQPTQVVADVALGALTLRLGQNLTPLDMKYLQARLGWAQSNARTLVWTQHLQFEQADGRVWPSGNVRLQWWRARAAQQAQAGGQLSGEQLDVAAIAQLARALPLGAAAGRAAQAAAAARGRIESLQLRWSGDATAPTDWGVDATLKGLELPPDSVARARPSDHARPATSGLALPGVQGADLTIKAGPAGGRLTLDILDGALEFPGVFEAPRIALDKLAAAARWTLAGDGQIEVNIERLHVRNSDAEGSFKAVWKTGPDAAARFPGALDLQGQFSRVDGARVHRYLPLAITRQARHYVREAIVQGQARDVAVRIQGNLDEVPFASNPARGQFRIAGRAADVVMACVPRALQPAHEPPWPALTGLSGQFIFERNSMQIKDARAGVQGHPDWEFHKIEAGIADLQNTRVAIQAEGQGMLAAALGIVRASPLADLTQHALDAASASGAMQLKLQTLQLPIADMRHARLKGGVTFYRNDIQMAPGQPRLSGVYGQVAFSETGFSLNDVRAQTLGGAVHISGGSQKAEQPAPADFAPIQVRATGTATAQALRGMTDWGPLAVLARQATGSAAYDATLAFRGGNQSDIQINSDLHGLDLTLPEPFVKPAAQNWPLRVDIQNTSGRERIRVKLAELLLAEYERDATQPAATAADAPRPVLRGALGVGAAATATLQLPATGVLAHVDLPHINADAWREITQIQSDAAAASGDSGSSNGGVHAAAAAMRDYLPERMLLRADELRIEGRALHQIELTATRQGTLWQAEIDAREMTGHIQYSEDGAGAVVARLKRLSLPQAPPDNNASGGDNSAAGLLQPPASIPALDIVADAFELGGKDLGRLELKAINLTPQRAARTIQGAPAASDWHLQTLRLAVPEASFNARGKWLAHGVAGSGDGAPPASAARRTELDFELDVQNASALLARFGMKDVLRRGKGQIAGSMDWAGAPTAIHYPSLNGQLHLDVGAGQFLKAEPGIAKLLGVLSLQALPRRLTLDFHDLFSSGFAFDFVRGDFSVQQGVAHTRNLQMKGVSAAVLMEGSADIVAETQDLRVLVAPEIDAGGAALAATAISPALGIGAFLAQLVLKKPLSEAATREFHITGAWDDPHVRAVQAGDAGSLRPKPAASAAPTPPASLPAQASARSSAFHPGHARQASESGAQ